MNKIINKVKKSTLLKLSFLYVVSLFTTTSLFAQSGKELFKTNCAACHSVGANKLVGPGLEGVNDLRSKEWLSKWIKNSAELIASGDADAIAIFEEFNKMPMPPQALNDEQIGQILDYVANPNAEAASTEAAAEPVTEGASELVLHGEKLFKTNCAACHSIGENKVVGPGLKGINELRSEEWLIKWVTNSAELIASGDADAKAIFEEFNKIPMPAQAVSADDIKAILAYIKNPPVAKGATAKAEVSSTEPKSDSTSTMIILVILIVVLTGIIMILNKARVTIAKAAADKEGVEFTGPVSFAEACKHTISKNKGIVATLVIVLTFVGLVDLMDGAFTIGVHNGYKPEQPIKFSHKVHAGDNKIDCNYCHSSARHSKTSGIPSLNVCMNCHKFVDGTSGKTFVYNGEEYPMPEEIKKIYKALDYNPESQEYGDNPTPVRWVKVHNLPDHVFYSHQQHVTVGGQKCQTCHGPVETMDVVEQYSPLTMKWCIECHAKTGVITEGNGYYEEMHSRMTEKYKEKWLGDGKLTVEEIGGWECAKCHY